MDRALAEAELREALREFEAACAALLAAMRDGADDVPARMAQVEACLRKAQELLARVERNRETRP